MRLGKNQLHVLMGLLDGPAKASELSGTFMPPEMASATLKNLAKRGLVKHDARTSTPTTWTTRWGITDAGRNEMERHK